MRNFILNFMIMITCFGFVSLADTVIPMESYGGVYRIPCFVNGAKMKFIFDTGASNVCLSLDMAEYLYDNDYINDNDFLGTGVASVADGRIVDHLKLNIKEIKIGDRTIRNVEAVVIKGQSAPLLFGQSALKKLGNYSISGNNLILKSLNHPSSTNVQLDLSESEIDNLFLEADESYDDGSYHVALEKYNLLFENDLLNAFGIMQLADCYYYTDDKEKALELYTDIQNEIETDFPQYKIDLYYNLGRCYWILKDYNKAIPFFEKVKLLATQWSDTQCDAVELLSNIYAKNANLYKANSIIDNYISQYLQYMGINATDCWDKLYTDDFLAELYYRQFLNYGIGKSFDKANKYVIISAAWGNKDAIEFCKEFNLNYQSKPTKYVY